MSWSENPVRKDEVAGAWRLVLLGLTVLLLIVMVSVGGCAGVKTFSRYQKRADANNRVKVTSINIRNARQQALVVTAQNAIVKAKADQRFIASVGIRRAQDEIAKTLTPLYIQHEAIEAQIATASHGNSTIYIPAGPSGVPIVSTTPPPADPQAGK